MTERPILFSAPMVRALLDGRKTQTRRLVKPRYDWHVDEVPDAADVFRPWPVFEAYVYAEPETIEVPCPYGAPGDRLWVRETWCAPPSHDHLSPRMMVNTTPIRYAADGVVSGVAKRFVDGDGMIALGRVRQSIFMIRWMSRITLEVTGVRVERLQAITEEDAMVEGAAYRISPGGDLAGAFDGCEEPINYRAHFRDLWESINGPGSWATNPWVWVVEFRRLP